MGKAVYNKIKKTELEKVNQLYNLDDMAKYFNVSKDVLKHALKYYNIKHSRISKEENLQIDIKELKEKYKDMTIKEMAKYFNCSIPTIKNRLIKNNIKIKNNNVTKEEIEMVKKYAKGHKLKEIVKKTGINENRLYKILNKNNIKYNKGKYKKVNIDDIDKLMNDKKKLSNEEICKKYGITHPAYINKILKKHNIKRTKEEQRYIREKQIKKKYGVDNVFRLEKVKLKIKKTNKKKYGCEYPSQNQKIKNKTLNKMKEKYGGIGLGSQMLKEKAQNTCKKKYGVANPFGVDSVKEKARQTNLEKYGCENVSQNKKIRKKIEQTNLKKLGVKVPIHNESVKQKMKKTCLERYGAEHILQVEKIKQKMKQTNLQKYGKTSYPQTEEFKQRVKATNQQKYGVMWACQRPEARLKGNDSEPNRIFAELLKQYKIKFSREFNLKQYSYDFKVGGMLIEINPSATHNITWHPFNKQIPKEYHYNKSKTATENGYHCIHIWDWDDSEKIVKLFLVEKQKVYARQCEIREIDKKEADKFLEEWHLQGKCRGNETNIGLYSKDELVMIMTFGKPRYNKNYEYELLRLCSSKVVVGGTDKIWKYFLENYKPKSVISYCDSSKFSGEVYEKLGFELKNKKIQPSKHWYHLKKKVHITDNLLKQRGFDQLLGKEYGCYGKGTSNTELMIEHGFVEVYDAGQQVWIWESEN